MNVTGVPLYDPRTRSTYPYSYEDTGKAGSIAQGVALGVSVWAARRKMAIREYWVTIEENLSKPGLLRAQIVTHKLDGSHYKLWFSVDGWHEDPFYDELSGTW
jgi:hypothetical protein